MTIVPRENVPMAAHTTFGIGGPARYWFEATSRHEVKEAIVWARDHGVRLEVLGGGSNVLIADRGLDALVLRVRMAERHVDGELVDVDAGVNWDDLVAWSVSAGRAGFECLSGIPGAVGAVPIQNVGAYGQEVASVIEHVEVIDRTSGESARLSHDDCAFGYRDSVFKGTARDCYVVASVRFRLKFGAPTIAYPELERAVAQREDLTLEAVRRTVLELRRAKSMVLDPEDDNRRSAGSFFLNPILPPDEAEQVRERAREHVGSEPPSYPADAGVKFPAAWLIERAGFSKGLHDGEVGISSRHSLAIVNRGGATARQLLDFAARVRDGVRARFGVALCLEPRLLGFEDKELAPLVS